MFKKANLIACLLLAGLAIAQQLAPYRYAEDFSSGQAAGWTSYPPVQDVAYDPSLCPMSGRCCVWCVPRGPARSRSVSSAACPSQRRLCCAFPWMCLWNRSTRRPASRLAWRFAGERFSVAELNRVRSD